MTEDTQVMDEAQKQQLADGLDGLTTWIRGWTVRKGWRVKGDHSSPDALGRTFGDEVALGHSEFSEALEAFREHGTERGFSGGPWEWIAAEEAEQNKFFEGHMLKPEGVASELADVVIRIVDTCAHYGFDLAAEIIAKMDYNETRSNRHGGKAL